MKSSEELDDEEKLNQFIKELILSFKVIELEKYCGYYDERNINNFSDSFAPFNGDYPGVQRRLRSVLKPWNNWCDESLQSNEKKCFLFRQSIDDDTVSEIAVRKKDDRGNNYALFNYQALTINDDFEVSISGKVNVSIPISNLKNKQELFTWFSENRIPQRSFHIIVKHGESREKIRFKNNKEISPLQCSLEQAQNLLNTAIGESIKELFNYDSKHDKFIVFKFEGETPQNMYHGYHIPKNSKEIPQQVKETLLCR